MKITNLNLQKLILEEISVTLNERKNQAVRVNDVIRAFEAEFGEEHPIVAAMAAWLAGDAWGRNVEQKPPSLKAANAQAWSEQGPDGVFTHNGRRLKVWDPNKI